MVYIAYIVENGIKTSWLVLYRFKAFLTAFSFFLSLSALDLPPVSIHFIEGS